MFTRYDGNPILNPRQDLAWQNEAVYNPAVVFLDGRIHLLYRGQAKDGTSSIGYAVSNDGVHIAENIDQPIFTPHEAFEQKSYADWNSGCEDPRITIMGERLYMTYTAYDGKNPPRVALTSISVTDFLARNWNWDKARLISPPGVEGKDCCITKKVKSDGYFAFHRFGNNMWIDNMDNLEFPEHRFLDGEVFASPRSDKWDNVKIGLGAPPIETEKGWILLYHGVNNVGFTYNMGAMLLDIDDPKKILGRTDEPLLKPEMQYEKQGQVENVVFGSGAILLNNTIYMYYGGADTVICVATIPLDELLTLLCN